MSSEIVTEPAEPASIAVLSWIEVNKQRIMVAAGILAVAGFVAGIVLHFRNQKEEEASLALVALTRPLDTARADWTAKSGDFLAIAEKYSGTSAAERALILGAGQLFLEGKPADARTKFEQFVSTFPNSELIPTAQLGIASSSDALNELDKAVQGYQQVITSYSTDPAATQARLSLGLLYETKNQPAEALKIYDEMARSGQNSVWTPEVSFRREQLLVKHPELAPKPAAAAAPAVPMLNAAPAVVPGK